MSPLKCRSAWRTGLEPWGREKNDGFRVARMLPAAADLRETAQVTRSGIDETGASSATAAATAARAPSGFRVAEGAKPEPYTNTGWAQEVVHEQTGLEMAFIPTGQFQMGSRTTPEETSQRYGGDIEWMKCERPVHTVRITRPFYMGKYEVTQEVWHRIMGTRPAFLKDDRRPIELVTWHECAEFLEKAGDGLRFPSEAEWEYACRAGTDTAFHFGNDASDLHRYAWYKGSSAERTHPVGEKLPNPWGLYDMHGNVFEMCADYFDKDYYQQSPVDDPAGPQKGAYGVIRGGSWLWKAVDCRSAMRSIADPATSHYMVGFRAAKTIEE